jgi:hypothetical protein
MPLQGDQQSDANNPADEAEPFMGSGRFGKILTCDE